MTSKKSPIFRVTGLPAEPSDEELDITLRNTIDKELSDEEAQQGFTTTVIPSCYDDLERAALVEFHGGAPKFLHVPVANPLESWQVEMGNTDINFDQNFFGFTQLYTPKANAPVTADVIAITGLDGHAYGSWRGKGNLGRMWLRHFLSEDLPCCRTMIYGYNSKLSSHGIDTIMDYGRELIEELKKVRNSRELRQRPLFFIAHSFGGIILAHCLVKAVQTNEDDHPTIATLHKATYGMLLFGIPHKGLVISDIQNMMAGEQNHPRNILLQQIRDKSDLLAYQLVDFKNLIRDRKIVSFYETGQTRQLEFNKHTKRWERTGGFVTAVDTDSALLQLPDSMEEKIPLDANHSMIVKFDSKNSRGYTSSRDKLRLFEQDAPKVVAARFLTQNKEFKELVSGCLKSLAFTETRNRFYGIDRAAKGTCEWLLQHEVYVKWTSCCQDLLWIKGIPGSGKSTVLQYALDNYHKTPEARDGALALAFFFHGRGDYLQKTSPGFIRSILCQILRQDPGTLQALIDVYSQRSDEIGHYGENWQWHRDELWRFFEDSLMRILKTRQIWLFVDALDECERNDASEIFLKFKNLLRDVPHAGLHRFQVCFSSRRYPDPDPKAELVINHDMENRGDISTYVRQQLSQFPGLEDSGIPALIISNAKNLFLWASIMVRKVHDKLPTTDSWTTLKDEIRLAPQELDDLYYYLTKNPEPGYVEMIRWICFALRPLSVDELRWAMTVDFNDCEYTYLQAHRGSKCFGPDDVRFEERVRLLSRGLAEVVPKTKVVQFIHESVKDFFVDKRGLESIVPSTEIGSITENAHYRLSRACIRYYTMREITQWPIDYNNVAATFPFLDYAVKSWIPHLELCDAKHQIRILGDSFGLQKDPPDSWIHVFEGLLQSWIRAFSIIDQHSRHRPPCGTTMLHVLSGNRLIEPLRKFLRESDCIGKAVSSMDEYGQTPLICATRNGLYDATRLLLNLGRADANAEDKQGRTPLWWAARNGHADVTELILSTNRVDVNVKDTEYGRTPLTLAARDGHAQVAKLILASNDVDVHAKDNASRLPIAWAAKNGHPNVLKVLLEPSIAKINAKDDDAHTPLSWAAKNGHTDVVELLLRACRQHRIEIDTVDECGRTPLSWAAGNGHSRVVEQLLDIPKRRRVFPSNSKGCDVNLKDSAGRTPLAWAALNGHTGTTQLLVEANAKINIKDRHGQTPLLLAVRKYQRMAKRFLHEDKNDTHTEAKEGQTPLLLAAESGHYAVVNLLLERKHVNVNSEGRDGWTPLIWAAKNGHDAMVKLLLDTGKADVNTRTCDGWMPLLLASKNGHASVVNLLLERKADVNAKDQEGWTSLIWAASNGHDSVVRLLLDRNADANATDKGGSTALLLAAGDGHDSVVESLLERKADINAKDQEGWTSLLQAASNGHDSVVKLLIRRQANINAEDQKGWTALLLASGNGYESVVKLLLERKEVDVNAKDQEGSTPLLLATGNGYDSVVKLLLERKEVDVNAKDQEGRTALLLATVNGFHSVVELLLEKKEVDINAKDPEDRTPLLWASENGFAHIAKLLLSTGGALVEAKDTEGKTPLLRAVEGGFAHVTKLLLKKGKADVNAKDCKCCTALLIATKSCRKAIVKLILDTKKAQINSKDYKGRTPLLWAAKFGYTPIVRLLLREKNIDTEEKDSEFGKTPLLWAAQNGRKTVVKLLLDSKNVDVNAVDIDGLTPLLWAARNGYGAVVKLLLLDEKVDLELEDARHGRTPLIWAAHNGRAVVVKLLLEADTIDVIAKDKEDRTPLAWAVTKGHRAVTELLLDADAVDVCSRDTYGRTPLSMAANSTYKNLAAILLDRVQGCIDERDNRGRTPLFWAARLGNEEMVKLLLDTNLVDINAKDHCGRTPLSCAVQKGERDVIKVLLRARDVDINAKDREGQTPLSWAVRSWDQRIVELLLATGKADVNTGDKRGRTPLIWAVEEGCRAVIKLLLDTKEVNVNATDGDGWTPLQRAVKKGDEEMVKLLTNAPSVANMSKSLFLRWSKQRK